MTRIDDPFPPSASGPNRDSPGRLSIGQLTSPISRLLVLLITILLLGSAQAADRVLLVNIAQYQEPRASLPGLERDIPLMEEVVSRLGFTSDQVRVLRDSQASKAGIERAVRDWLITGVGNEDRVIFYFSGHGAQTEDSNVPGGCRSGLLTYDMQLLVDHELQALIAQIPARETMILVDSCFSGGAVRSRLSGNLTNAKVFQPMAVQCNVGVNELNLEGLTRGFKPQSNSIIMTASAHNEVALMNREIGSFFTVALHEAAMTASRELTFEGLRARASTIIRDRIEGSTSYLPHNPQLLGNSEWFHKDFFSFGALAGAPRMPPSGPTDTHDLIDHVVNNSQFRVEMVSPRRTFRLGEALTLRVASSKPGYINILDVGPDGNVTLLFPNSFNRDNSIEANAIIDIPGPRFGNFNLIASEPTGQSRLLALVTTQPLQLFDSEFGSMAGGTFRVFDSEDFRNLWGSVSMAIVTVAEQNMRDEHGAATIRLLVER